MRNLEGRVLLWLIGQAMEGNLKLFKIALGLIVDGKVVLGSASWFVAMYCLLDTALVINSKSLTIQ